MRNVEIHLPDLGDFEEVLVAEVFVKVGDTLELMQPIISVETDKATTDIPSPSAGRIAAILVNVGDKVAKGTLLASVEHSNPAPAQTAEMGSPAASTTTWEDRSAPVSDVTVESKYDLVVIGGGPGGYSAAFRAADLGLNVALVERYETLGGVCLNVGCIPSKALLHIAAIKEEAERLATHGVIFDVPIVDLEKIRTFKMSIIRRLTDGLAQIAKLRKVERITGVAKFGGDHHLVVSDGNKEGRRIDFEACIVAAGSSPVALSFLPDDPRIVNSTGALELSTIPRRMLVIGGGIIGLEMATIYSALGARVDVVEQLNGILAGVDRDLVAIWQKRNAHRFNRMMLSTTLKGVSPSETCLSASFDGDHADGDYDLILQAAGRTPNAGLLDLESAGVIVERGFIKVDRQMKTSVSNIYAIGDIVGQPMLAHKAVHEAHVAAEAAAGHKTAFEPMVVPSVAYLDPEIAWVGLTEDAAKASGVDVTVSRFPWSASGRAIANGADYGMTKLIFSKEAGRIVGGAIVGPHAGDMIGEICLAIELGADALDIGRTIHPHPTLGETIGMAAEVAEGVCTDLAPQRRAQT